MAINLFFEKTLYQISTDLETIITLGVVPEDIAGTRTIKGQGGYGSTYSYKNLSKNVWGGLTASDELIYSIASVPEVTFKYSKSGNVSGSEKETPIYLGNPATTVGLFSELAIYKIDCSGNELAGTAQIMTFAAQVNGSYCNVSWSGVDCFDGLYAKKIVARDGEGCSFPDGFTVTVTILPQGLTASYTQPAADSAPPVVSGDQGIPGTRGPLNTQYVVTGGNAPYKWANSKGTITDTGYATFSGCGTAVITVTDVCGKTGTLEVALETGVWILDVTRTLPVGCETNESNNCGFPVVYYGYVCGARKYDFVNYLDTTVPHRCGAGANEGEGSWNCTCTYSGGSSGSCYGECLCCTLPQVPCITEDCWNTSGTAFRARQGAFNEYIWGCP